ncbi:hypothetical protein [Ketobacter sp.]|uniref:hypothetical protein n=1 Tax=Ketobacter sp. TaxID=2083498 RepID=UPI000F283831|nr:hypothetical protein [Ketobacter sp.]RLU00282.1 MAG: hypothetical protein D9N14_07270 [Ketobacter sp.]
MTGSPGSLFRTRLLPLIRSPRARVITAALASAITWFCWAYWANRELPEQALVSGLFQGGVNLLTTAFGSALLEALFLRFGDSAKGQAGAILLVSSGSLCLMLVAHWLAATPNVLLTVLPVYTVVLIYCTSYVVGLNKIKTKYEAEEVAVP